MDLPAGLNPPDESGSTDETGAAAPVTGAYTTRSEIEGGVMGYTHYYTVADPRADLKVLEIAADVT